jgi:uncharacterized protein YndB with AHSA1/START domain
MTTYAPDTPASPGRTVVTTPDDTSIVMTRSFEAPRELVFELWTDPDVVPSFWGPAAYTSEVVDWKLRAGGAWRIITTTDSGQKVDFHGTFVRVEQPALIEWTFGFDDVPPSPETLFIDEADGVTTLRSVSVYPDREIRDMVLGTGMEAGAAEMHDRFATVLKQQAWGE